MLQWIGMAILTAATSLAVLLPLFRGREGRADRASAGTIYRDQLTELEADIARGAIGAAEAEAARAEISRRLIKNSGPAEPPETVATRSKLRLQIAMVVALIAVP